MQFNLAIGSHFHFHCPARIIVLLPQSDHCVAHAVALWNNFGHGNFLPLLQQAFIWHRRALPARPSRITSSSNMPQHKQALYNC